MDADLRDNWLSADDAALLAECDVDTYRASGPGGQKRNKTSSAVRLRHRPSGILVIAEESRSQHENKAKALRRLRRAIALGVRCRIDPDWRPPGMVAKYLTAGGRLEISQRNEDYPLVMAHVLDVIAALKGHVSEAAGRFGLSTSQLSRFVTDNGKLLGAVNDIRRAEGIRPLTVGPR